MNAVKGTLGDQHRRLAIGIMEYILFCILLIYCIPFAFLFMICIYLLFIVTFSKFILLGQYFTKTFLFEQKLLGKFKRIKHSGLASLGSNNLVV